MAPYGAQRVKQSRGGKCFIQFINVLYESHKTDREGVEKVPRPNRKDERIPTFVAYKANLDALVKIRRHYLEQRGY